MQWIWELLTAGLFILWFGLEFIVTKWCIEGNWFLESFWNALGRKFKRMQQLWFCIEMSKRLEIAVGNRKVEVLYCIWKCIMEPIWFYYAGLWKYLKCATEKLEIKDVVQMVCESTGEANARMWLSFLVREILESLIMRIWEAFVNAEWTKLKELQPVRLWNI